MDQGLVKLLEQMISLPSVNNAWSVDPAIAGEARMADFCAEYLGRLGFAIARDEVEPGRPNITAAFGPTDARHTIVWTAHLDTVGVQGMEFDPFTPFVKDGRLFGRGACDDKGPLAAALWALHQEPAALQQLAAAGVRLLVIGVMGEETGNTGALRLVEQGIRADECLVLEPTDNAIVHAHKGALWLEVTVQGRAAHGSTPHLGVSAIRGMAQVMDRLWQWQAADEATVSHPLLGRPTLNLGTIHGGDGINTVPAECTLGVDRRLVPGEDPQRLAGRLEEFLGQLQAAGTIVGSRVRIGTRAPAFINAPDSPMARCILAACRACGAPGRTTTAGWFSDAGPLARQCPDTLVFGPGSIKDAHTRNESIDLAEMELCGRILRDSLRRWTKAAAHQECTK